MGMQKYRERRYGASIQWFLRAAHHVHALSLPSSRCFDCISLTWPFSGLLQSRLSQVANKLVDDYYQGKSINADEVTAVVEQLDKDFIFSERLVFLSKVRDLNFFKEVRSLFHSLHPCSRAHTGSALYVTFSPPSSVPSQQKNWRAVAELTVEVISKNLAPRRYWIRLLREVVPLLEGTGLPHAIIAPALFLTPLSLVVPQPRPSCSTFTKPICSWRRWRTSPRHTTAKGTPSPDRRPHPAPSRPHRTLPTMRVTRRYTKNISEEELVAIRLALARNRARAICL
jgi:hypothetical protein